MITHRKSPIAQDILALAKQLGNSGSKSRQRESATGQQPVQAETADDSAKSKRSFWRSVGQFGASPSGAK